MFPPEVECDIVTVGKWNETTIATLDPVSFVPTYRSIYFLLVLLLKTDLLVVIRLAASRANPILFLIGTTNHGFHKEIVRSLSPPFDYHIGIW
jgi:hypothetical protein